MCIQTCMYTDIEIDADRAVFMLKFMYMCVHTHTHMKACCVYMHVYIPCVYVF